MRITPIREKGYPLWPPILAMRGPGGKSAGHAHHAIHVVLALDGELAIDVGGATSTAVGVITAPDVVHQLDARGREIELVFLDPESAAGAAILGTIEGPARLLTIRERDALIADPLEVMQTDGWAERAASSLGASPIAPRRVHPRVRRVLAHLRRADCDADTSLPALAEIAGLSEGRLMHAFTESVGIPLRPYLLWLRLQRAAAGIAGGASFVEAAHAAGFTDASHLTRAFARMFGMRPAELRRAIASATT